MKTIRADRAAFALGFVLSIVIGPTLASAASFVRGDANRDAAVDVGDPVAMLFALFAGGPALACPAAADLNDDEVVNLADVIWTLRYLFSRGATPRPPFPSAGADPTPGLPCPPTWEENRPPTLTILAPTQGAVVDAAEAELRLRLSDDSRVLQVLVNGADLTPPGPPAVPYEIAAAVALAVGPNLLRIEAVDDLGRTTFRELALCRTPQLGNAEFAPAIALHLSGDRGYGELEALLQPFLNGLPALLDGAIRGVLLYSGSVLGVDLRVTGREVQVSGALGLDLFPSAAGAAGRVGMRVTVPQLRLLADGRSDYGFLGTDNWTATWVAQNLVLSSAFQFLPRADGSGVTVQSDGFTLAIGSSDLTVSGFLDPLGIFDGVVNFLADQFRADIEAAARREVERLAREQILPVLQQAFDRFDISLALGDLRLTTRLVDAVEDPQGLAFRLDGNWIGPPRVSGYPAYPGTAVGRSPLPAFPLGVAAPHPVEASFSISADTLNQALAGLAASGAFQSFTALESSDPQFPLVAGTVALLVDPRYGELPGVDPEDPLALRIDLRKPPLFTPGVGIAGGAALVPGGASWRYWKGASAPPASWSAFDFADGAWPEGAGAFGYSSSVAEQTALQTLLDDMAEGYTTLYLRHSFEVADPTALGSLLLRVVHDDGFVAYLNGQELARVNAPGSAGSALPVDAVAAGAIEPSRAEIALANPAVLLRRGRNVLALQGLNAAAASSDFLLSPELWAAPKPAAGASAPLPAQLDLAELVVTIAADTAADGVGETDRDRRADEVDLVGFRFALTLQAGLRLAALDGGALALSVEVDGSDSADPDIFPDALAGGAAGLGLGVAFEAVNVDDSLLLSLAQLILGLFGPSLGTVLESVALPQVPLPELEFDLDRDGSPDVSLALRRSTLAAVDTDGGRPDWICILSELEARPQ